MIREITDPLKELLRIDSELKDLMTNYQLKKINSETFSDKLRELANDIEYVKMSLKDTKIFIPDPADFSQELLTATKALTYMLPYVEVRSSDFGEIMKNYIKELDDTYRKFKEEVSKFVEITGYPEHCAIPSENKPITLYVNDITQCLHLTTMLALEVSKMSDTEKIEYDLCTVYLPKNKKEMEDVVYSILEDPVEYWNLPEDKREDPIIKGTFICSIWKDAANWIYGLKFTSDPYEAEEYMLLRASVNDIKALSGYVTEYKTYLRVGSQLGHFMEYDPNKDEIKYYDPDDKVRKLFLELMRDKLGVSCEDVNLKNLVSHVKCKVDPDNAAVNDRGLYDLGLVMASVTGMDSRLMYSPVLSELVGAFKNREDVNPDGVYQIMRLVEGEFIGGDNENKYKLNYMVTKNLWYL